MTMNFLLHKDRKENKENATAQKQECGCPSLQPSLRSHTHAFFADTPADNKLLINILNLFDSINEIVLPLTN
jgi:hypothetical protein